jgi:putative FmdB family regulatory protein
LPIYEFVCDKCGKKFERWSKQTRDMEWTELCPDDGGTGKRIISPTSFALKDGGVGWAKDGYNGGKNEKPEIPAVSGSD